MVGERANLDIARHCIEYGQRLLAYRYTVSYMVQSAGLVSIGMGDHIRMSISGHSLSALLSCRQNEHSFGIDILQFRFFFFFFFFLIPMF